MQIRRKNDKYSGVSFNLSFTYFIQDHFTLLKIVKISKCNLDFRKRFKCLSFLKYTYIIKIEVSVCDLKKNHVFLKLIMLYHTRKISSKQGSSLIDIYI